MILRCLFGNRVTGSSAAAELWSGRHQLAKTVMARKGLSAFMYVLRVAQYIGTYVAVRISYYALFVFDFSLLDGLAKGVACPSTDSEGVYF